MTSQLASVLLPVFAVATVGYAWRKLDYPFEREFITRLVMNIAGPCLTIDSLSRLSLPFDEFASMIGAAVAMLIATAFAAYLILRLARLPVRSFLPSLTIGNAGNLGLPLCLFAFGQEGLGLAVAVFVTYSVGQFTLTPLLQSGSSPWRTLSTTPVIYGAAIGTVIFAGDIELAGWISTTISLFGSLMIPLMLLALGYTLGGLQAKRFGFASVWGAARLLIGFGIAFGIAELFGLEGVAKGVLILLGSMPAAVFNYLFAARYDRHPDDVAGIVLVSTLLSAITLPALIAFVLKVAG